MGHTFWGLHCPSFQSKQTENSFAFAQKGDPKMPAAPFPARFPLCAEKKQKEVNYPEGTLVYHDVSLTRSFGSEMK